MRADCSTVECVLAVIGRNRRAAHHAHRQFHALEFERRFVEELLEPEHGQGEDAGTRQARQHDQPLLAIDGKQPVLRAQTAAHPTVDFALEAAQMLERQTIERRVGLRVERDHSRAGSVAARLGHVGGDFRQRGQEATRAKRIHVQAR